MHAGSRFRTATAFLIGRAPLSHVVDGFEGVVGTVDTSITLLPKGFHPIHIGIHEAIYTLSANVTLTTTTQAVVASDIKYKEGVFLGVGQVAVHNRVDTVYHLHGIGLVNREVRGILHRKVLGIQEIVAGASQHDGCYCNAKIT